jgi:hypothetical protein
VGNGWDVVEKYIREQDIYEYNREREIKKTIAIGLVLFVRGIPVTEGEGCFVHLLEHREPI